MMYHPGLPFGKSGILKSFSLIGEGVNPDALFVDL